MHNSGSDPVTGFYPSPKAFWSCTHVNSSQNYTIYMMNLSVNYHLKVRSIPITKPNTFPKKPARQKWTGPIYLPGHKYKLLSKRQKMLYKSINVEAINKFKTSRNINQKDVIHDVYEDAQDSSPPSIDEQEFQECQDFNTDKDLEPPTDDLLDYIISQEHSDSQLDQVLQTYQAYQEPQSETQNPKRQMNAHITYHVLLKQAKQDMVL